MDWVKTTARRDEKCIWRFGAADIRGLTVLFVHSSVRKHRRARQQANSFQVHLPSYMYIRSELTLISIVAAFGRYFMTTWDGNAAQVFVIPRHSHIDSPPLSKVQQHGGFVILFLFCLSEQTFTPIDSTNVPSTLKIYSEIERIS